MSALVPPVASPRPPHLSLLLHAVYPGREEHQRLPSSSHELHQRSPSPEYRQRIRSWTPLPAPASSRHRCPCPLLHRQASPPPAHAPAPAVPAVLLNSAPALRSRLPEMDAPPPETTLPQPSRPRPSPPVPAAALPAGNHTAKSHGLPPRAHCPVQTAHAAPAATRSSTLSAAPRPPASARPHRCSQRTYRHCAPPEFPGSAVPPASPKIADPESAARPSRSPPYAPAWPHDPAPTTGVPAFPAAAGQPSHAAHSFGIPAPRPRAPAVTPQFDPVPSPSPTRAASLLRCSPRAFPPLAHPPPAPARS